MAPRPGCKPHSDTDGSLYLGYHRPRNVRGNRLVLSIMQSSVNPPLACEMRGSGNTCVVLLHGFLGSGRNLASLGRRLCDANPALCALLPDLNGHGASQALPLGACVADVAASVWALVDAQRHHQVIRIVGHSMGARVALAMLGARPALVDKAVVIDMAPGRLPPETDHGEVGRVLQVLMRAPPEAPNRSAMRALLLQEGLGPAMADWLLQSLKPAPQGVVWRVDRAFLQGFFSRGRSDDWWPVVKRYAAKLVWVCGGNSAYVGAEDRTRLMTCAVPCHIIAGAGHFVHVDQPEALLDCLQHNL